MRQFLPHLIQDFRFTFRQLHARPAFALSAVVVLALGIGSSTAVFNVFYQVLLKTLPYSDAERLFFVHNSFPRNQVSTAGVSGFDYAAIRRQTELFADAGIFYWNDLTLTGRGNARHLNVINASASLFRALGIKPELGRTFSTREDQYGAPGTAVLSDRLWRSNFDADPKVLGRPIYLNGVPYTVVGVMPQRFEFPSRESEIWIPVALRPGNFTLEGGRLEKWLHMVAKLSPGVSLEKAKSGLQAISARLGADYPALYQSKDGWQFTLRQIADEQTENVRRWLYLAFGAVLSVLLIACINVSGLLLIRGHARRSEIAVRRAIGAPKSRIVLQILTETGVLVVLSCVPGVLLSAWIVHLVNVFGPLGQPIGVHIESLFFALGAIFVSTIVAGLIPALLAVRLPPERAWKSSATRTTTRDSGARYAIVAAQIAFAVSLVFTATQLNRSFLNLTRVPAGFERQHIWTGALTLPSHRYIANQSWNTSFFEPLLKRLRALPGVEAASGANAIPFNPSGTWTEEFRLPDGPKLDPRPQAQIDLAFPGYFETIGIPLLKGRTFTDRDRSGTPPVALVDEALARRYFPDEEPLGKLIASGGAATPATIIGIVGSVTIALSADRANRRSTIPNSRNARKRFTWCCA